MNHQEARESNAAERYLLAEMSAEEREAFEQHLFECADCGEDVNAGVTFIEGLKQADARDRLVPFRAARSRAVAWMSSVAASLLLFVAGYQSLVLIPRMRPAFAAIPAPAELNAPTRGAEDGVVTELGPGVDRIIVPIVSDAPVTRYEVELRDGRGKVLGTAQVTAQQAEQPVEFQLPPLPAGSYAVAARGVREDGNRLDAGTFRFKVGN